MLASIVATYGLSEDTANKVRKDHRVLDAKAANKVHSAIVWMRPGEDLVVLPLTPTTGRRHGAKPTPTNPPQASKTAAAPLAPTV